MAEQNLANHGNFFPPFHFFVVPVLTVNLIYSLYWWGKMGFAPRGILQVLVAAALAVGFLGARVMAVEGEEPGVPVGEPVGYQARLPPALHPPRGAVTGEPVAMPRI